MQAQMLIPMAISLAFGILFATVITLFLIPSLYLLQEDLGKGIRSAADLLLGRDPQPAAESATRYPALAPQNGEPARDI